VIAIASAACGTDGAEGVTDLPGSPAEVVVLTEPPATVENGAVLSQQPVVEVRDANGDLLVGVDVAASIASGSGVLSGTTTDATDDAGRAVFADLSISGAVGAYAIRFQAGSAGVISQAIALGAGPAATLTIVTPPSSATPSGASFAQQPVVEVEDVSGNPVSGSTVTASLASGSGSLGGTTTATVGPSGVASFQNLSISGAVGVRTLRFAVGATGATSGPISVTPGPVAQLVITQQPSSNVLNAVQFPQQPRVRALDEWSNAIDGISVVATIASGGGNLAGTTTVTSNSAAGAVFTNLSVMGIVGAHTLRFSAGAESVTSSSVHVAYGEGFYTDIQYCGSHEAQRMDVSVPSNAHERPLPVAAYIHGGGWNGGDKSAAPLLPQVRSELLARGYVVVSLNYRLGRHAKWPAQIQDVKCAIRHLRSQAADYGLDAELIGSWGGSAGGQLSSMLAVTDASSGFEGNGGYGGFSSRVRAAVSFGTVSDMTEPWASQGHPELNFVGPEATFLSWPGPSAELNEASPIWWTSSDDAPLLLMHGEQDTTVLPPQATRLLNALQAVGADGTLRIVLNGGHNLDNVGFGTPTPSLSQVVDEIADFFDQHLRLVAP
jgi:acetyl esterase/lipase